MATAQEAIKRLTYEFVSTGADKIEAELKRLGRASGDSVELGKQVEKTATSQATAFNNLERRYISTTRNQQDYARVQQQVAAMTAQYPALQERGNAVLAAAAERYGQAGLASRAFAAATSGVQGQLIALSAGAGPVGVFLSSLGPWGIAAAAGIGLAEKALGAMVDEANRMGAFAQALRNAAQTIGVTTDQQQALNIVAASVGISTDKNTLAFERFTSQLNELRKGSGTLYTELLAVDRGLVSELASTKDAAKAIDILASAYAAATDQVKKNAIARAAFGRQGFDEGRVLTAIDAAGGLEAYKSGLNATDLLTQEQIKHWALLSVEIEHATSMARNNIASIFTSQVLESEKTFADAFLEISRVAKELNQTDVGHGFFAAVAAGIADAIPGLSALRLALTAAKGVVATAPVAKPTEIDPFGTFTTGGKYTSEIDATSAQFQASQYKALVAALGSAATASEHLHEKQLSLLADFKAGTITQETYKRALAGANVEYTTTAINARLAALGVLASATDVALQEQLKIDKANREGASIDATRAKTLQAIAVARFTESQITTKANVGIADATEMAAQKQREYNAINASYVLTEQQKIGLMNFEEKKWKDIADAAAVAASRFPNFTRASLDAQNFNKQLDTLAVSGVDHLADSMVAVLNHTQSMGDAFKALGLTVIAELEKMIIKMLIFRSLSSMFGGGFSLGSLFSFGGGSVGGQVAAFHSGGTVGSGGTPRFIHPAYFDDAPRMHAGGNIDWAAGERPMVGLVGERVLNRQETANYGRSGGTNIQIVTMPGNTFDHSADSNGNIKLVERLIDKKISANNKTFPDKIAAINRDPRAR